MSHIIEPLHARNATKARQLLSAYMEAEDLINIGAYKKGSNPHIDEAINKYPAIIEFLKQEVEEKVTQQQSVEELRILIEAGE